MPYCTCSSATISLFLPHSPLGLPLSNLAQALLDNMFLKQLLLPLDFYLQKKTPLLPSQEAMLLDAADIQLLSHFLSVDSNQPTSLVFIFFLILFYSDSQNNSF